MRKCFYLKLAWTNIYKNKKFYLPYLFTCIGSSAMFYIMCALSGSSGIDAMQGAQSVRIIMGLGCVVIGLFSVVFMFYTHSFLMKQRKKELGLYNILGMEKRHVGKMLFFESLIVYVVGMAFGLGCGMLFEKLMIMILYKMIGTAITISFEIFMPGIIATVLLFGSIFLLILVYNQARIHLSSPVEMLRDSSAGEKEPKIKWITAVLGFVCLGSGYAIAISVQTPLKALFLFFIAVILVIIGTYCLFTAGSIAILKGLRKNKSYYYTPNHFTSVSGMLYRMRQNAVGLANICILSTMVLVMISTTVSLYVGTEDAIQSRYPEDMIFEGNYRISESENKGQLEDMIRTTVQDNKLSQQEIKIYDFLSFAAIKNEGGFETPKDMDDTNSLVPEMVCFITKDDYNSLTGQNITLEENQVIINSTTHARDTLQILNKTFEVKEYVDTFPSISGLSAYLTDVTYVVVPDDQTLVSIEREEKTVYVKAPSSIRTYVGVITDGTDEEKIRCFKDMRENVLNGDYFDIYAAYSKQDMSKEFKEMDSSFLFLGVFLGCMFMMATVLIIYYKQISEGYDDKKRFEIMQKVGMSRREVKAAIRSQVLCVFFFPLLLAGVHILAAFPMITKLLLLFQLNNVLLFAICTVVTLGVFAAIYAAVYGITAREYYKIIGEQE